MIIRDDLIKEALFTISAQSAIKDYECDATTRLQIYKIYEGAVKYVTKVARIPLLIKTVEPMTNTTLGDGWYYMPNDFVSWYSKIPDSSFFVLDDESQYSVFLLERYIKYYAFNENLTDLDVYFKQAVKWTFLSELKISDRSIMESAQLIYNEKKECIQRLREESKFYNILSGV